MISTELEAGPSVLVVSEEPAAGQAAVTAIARAGGRALATLDWTAAVARAETGVAAVVMIEAAGIDPDRLADELPRLVAAAGAERTVIAFGSDQLDTVAAALIDSSAILLCDPEPADRIAALVQTFAGPSVFLSENREEAERLARINQEVARFTETLARLTGGTGGGAPVAAVAPLAGERTSSFHHAPRDGAVPAAADIRSALRARRLRDAIFQLPGLFEDPAWDMTLDLFAAELEGRRVSVSSLCIAAAVAPTTALRWISKLIALGLFVREPDAHDRRRAFVALAPRGSMAMREYTAALGRSGLAIA